MAFSVFVHWRFSACEALLGLDGVGADRSLSLRHRQRRRLLAAAAAVCSAAAAISGPRARVRPDRGNRLMTSVEFAFFLSNEIVFVTQSSYLCPDSGRGLP